MADRKPPLSIKTRPPEDVEAERLRKLVAQAKAAKRQKADA